MKSLKVNRQIFAIVFLRVLTSTTERRDYTNQYDPGNEKKQIERETLFQFIE